MSAAGGIFALPGSRVRRFAEAISWLWRLGPVCESPDRAAVGLGWLDEMAELRKLVRSGELAGAAVFAARPGPRTGRMPGRHRRAGTPSFGPDCRIGGDFYVLDAKGEAVVRSELGAHAVRDGAWMLVGADPDASWGALDNAWVLSALADFLVDVLDRPLALLPPIGWVRYDDAPGSAYHQLAGRYKPDRKMQGRLSKAVSRFAAAGACLNIAIPPRTLVNGRETPVDEVWPRSIAAIQDGLRDGHVEPVYHGYLHLDTAAWEAGQLSPREFENVGREEADRRLDIAFEWFAETFGPERRTFVAPVWTYSDGLLEALADRGVPTWLPPDLGPLAAANTVHETIYSTMEGLVGLDYGPFGMLANVGLPPTVVIHGGLFDARMHGLRDRRQVVSAARLFLRRDMLRVPWVEGVRWIGASELVDRLRAHDRVSVNGSTVTGPAGTAVVVRDRTGSRAISLDA